MSKIKTIYKTVNEVFGVEIKTPKGSKDKTDVTEGKYAYSLLCRDLTPLSYREIGEFINRDHATILYHKNCCLGQLDVNKNFIKKYTKCLELLPTKMIISSKEEKIESLKNTLKKHRQNSIRAIKKIRFLKTELEELKTT